MPYYRALANLTAGSKQILRGDIFSGSLLRPDVIAALEGRYVSRITAPPLAELPGWTRRAERLQPAGIVDIEQFLEAADSGELSSLFAPEQIKRWRGELLSWLAPPRKGG